MTTAIPQDIADTIVERGAYADERASDAFRWLRNNIPLGKTEPKGFDPMWVVTRHADIREISLQNRTFLNGGRQIILTSKADLEEVYRLRSKDGQAARNLIQMDLPEHGKYRMMTQSWFMPSNLRKIEDEVRATARHYVDKMLETGGKCDFVKEVALHYPMRVIMTILGVPIEDEPLMHKLTQQIFAQDEQSDTGSLEDRKSNLEEARLEFARYFGALAEDRRRNPRGDLATVIATAKIDGEPLPFGQELGYFILMATAGHDTTTNGTAGSMLALAQHPGEFAKLKADPSLIPVMAEEAVRWTTPVKHFMRNAAQDAEVAGHKIAKGDMLMLSYYSANRDEAVWEDPYSFRVDRPDNGHLAFGHGAHVCLGQFLARMELCLFWEELLPHVKSLGLDGEATIHPANFINGPNFIPLVFESA